MFAHRWQRSRAGQALVEYALLLLTTGLAAALVLTLAGPLLANGFQSIVDELGSTDKPAQPAPPPVVVAGPPPGPEEEEEAAVWHLQGFYAPVELGGLFNTVKGGATVPLKFELYKDGVEQTDPASVGALKTTLMACDTFADESEIDATSSGGTELRYDAAAGYFVYNWKTPKVDGVCLKVRVAAADGTALVAYFKLKDKAA